MKTNMLFFLLPFFFIVNASAQTIDSIVVVPSNPTTSDTIKVIVYSNSPYTYCQIDSFEFDTTNSQISITAFTQIGDLAAPCYSIDTLTIGLLNAGDYELICDLGTGTPPTTYDTDTIYFTIQLANGLQFIDNLDQRIKIYPNPVNNWLTFSVKKSVLGKVKIDAFDLTGKLVLSEHQLLQNEVLKVNVSSIINDGVYLFKLTFTDGTSEVFKVSVNR